jgi:hypothetical protein
VPCLTLVLIIATTRPPEMRNNVHLPAACVPCPPAGLCVILVHFPALIAKSLLPSLYPLRLALFDPLTQVGWNLLII